jgi:hypothetical protein
MKLVLLGCLTIGLLVACSQSPKNVSTTVFTNLDGSHITYRWLPDIKKRLVPETAQEVVKKTDEVLKKKGYKRLYSGNSDFLMSFDITSLKSTTKVEKSSGFEDYGPGVNCQSGDCVSTNRKTRITERKVNFDALVRLQLKAEDTKNQKILWQTQSETQVVLDFDPDLIERPLDIKKAKRTVDAMVIQMLKDVPARP